MSSTLVELTEKALPLPRDFDIARIDQRLADVHPADHAVVLDRCYRTDFLTQAQFARDMGSHRCGDTRRERRNYPFRLGVPGRLFMRTAYGR
ncbi:hypothetical protein [Bradyrhizobium genosp. P]|uniref:hypothetical protein n=1 Tax=Bradyrhizobium genosp. P TaxID=83641 RepID=UPI003CE68CA1